MFFDIEIYFKCEAPLLFFQIKNKKNFKKLLKYILYIHDVTCNLSRLNNRGNDIY